MTNPNAELLSTENTLFPPPLTWWREQCARSFTPEHAQTLRRRLERATIPGERRFRDAKRGDAAAAIGIVLRLIRDPSARTHSVDIACSALLLCALNGDWATRDVLTLVLRRMGNSTATLIAESWRAAPPVAPLPASDFGTRRRERIAHRANWARRQPTRAVRPMR